MTVELHWLMYKKLTNSLVNKNKILLHLLESLIQHTSVNYLYK